MQSYLLWSDLAFRDRSPLAVVGAGAGQEGSTILRPDIAGLIRAAYDPMLPVASADASHTLRLYARMTAGGIQ